MEIKYSKYPKSDDDIINTTEKSDIGFANICTYIGENCPELKESEDEKIRKEILDYIDKATGCKRWVAWLEKQGEQKSLDDIAKEVIKDKDTATSFLKSCGIMNENGELADEYKIEQGEQNLNIPKWKYKKDNKPLLRDSIILNKYGCVAKSPSGALVSDVWVIDYDELLKLPKEELENSSESSENTVEKVDTTEYDKGFECGKQRVLKYPEEFGLCKSTSWSEEDEKYYNSIIEHLKYSITNGKPETYKSGRLTDWLKFHKARVQPQSQWSEEEQQVIKDAACVILSCVNVAETKQEEERLEKLAEKLQDLIPLGKSTKVAPKFKVGDWVVFNNKHQSTTYQVEKIEYGYYILRHTHGGTFRVCVLHDEGLRLWTIEDAKDGDVLQLGEVTVIFKELIGNGHCRCYCSVYNEEFEIPSQDGADNSYAWYNATPATKEQRDLLFQKMKDAGYEWYTEKKELKKSEQNSVWSEEDDENLKWFEKFFRAESVIAKGKDIPQDRYMWFKNLKDRVQPQSKQDWSEKDSPYYDDICEILINLLHSKTADVNKDAVQKDLDWLISIKKRVQPKNFTSQKEARDFSRVRMSL